MSFLTTKTRPGLITMLICHFKISSDRYFLQRPSDDFVFSNLLTNSKTLYWQGEFYNESLSSKPKSFEKDR